MRRYLSKVPIITDWKKFVPTGSWTTNTTYTGRWRRVGDSLDLDVLVSLAGAPDAATFTLNIPFGLKIDTTRALTKASVSRFGWAVADDAAANQYFGHVMFSTTTTLIVFALDSSGTILDISTNFNQGVPFVFGASDAIYLRALGMPIVGWGANRSGR